MSGCVGWPARMAAVSDALHRRRRQPSLKAAGASRMKCKMDTKVPVCYNLSINDIQYINIFRTFFSMKIIIFYTHTDIII